MLVAKAVVRSVHSKSPAGRFVEKVSGPGGKVWKECEYKKSVDKASQALREKWEESPDDEILKASMQLMFDKKLDAEGGWGGAERSAVEEAVYFAVTTVALEYAKRWGTPSFHSLTKVLQPIVVASKKAKGKRPTKPKAKRAVAAPTAIVAKVNTAKLPSVPRRAISSPPIAFYHQIGRRTLNFQMGSFGSPVRGFNTAPRMNTTRTGKPLPFANTALPANGMSPPPRFVQKSPETYGAPAPPETVVAQSKRMDISNESSPLSPLRTKIYVHDAKATVSDESETSNAGDKSISMVSPPPDKKKPAVATATTTPPSPRKRGRPRKTSTENKSANIAVKRKMNNIMTVKEIEADIRKRPKNHGMSPFHQEMLKM
ncbi:MAG: hypothetical protein SGILL_009806, partial [Bacillariaceae sp.]